MKKYWKLLLKEGELLRLFCRPNKEGRNYKIFGFELDTVLDTLHNATSCIKARRLYLTSILVNSAIQENVSAQNLTFS